MGAAMNGMALHGGVLPVGGTFFVFSDYLRPTLRLAVAVRGQGHLRVHPRLGRPRRGRPHPPADRAPRRRPGHPRLQVIRPADANETAAAWRVAVDARRPHRADPDPPGRAGASPTARRGAPARPSCATSTTPSSCSSARAARWPCASTPPSQLTDRTACAVRVVSMPSWDRFGRQTDDVPSRRAARPACRRCRSRRRPRSAGSAGPTPPSASTASGPARQVPSRSTSSASTRTTSWRGRSSCSPPSLTKRRPREECDP